MKIMYLVLAHRAPCHARRLFGRLAESGEVLVHIDRRANQSNFRIRNDRVEFTRDRLALNWGGWTVVDATV